jgi:hypothetical protein
MRASLNRTQPTGHTNTDNKRESNAEFIAHAQVALE